MRWLIAVMILSLVITGCGLPRDPEGTLGKVREGSLRVGVIVDEPWTIASEAGDSGPAGLEAELVRRLAQHLNADVEWSVGSDSRLMQSLERFELDLVIGGVDDTTAWKERVGLTSPYVIVPPPVRIADGFQASPTRRHVLAVPPGENGWLRYVDGFLRQERDFIQEQLEEEAGYFANSGAE